jgi:hypothetical protein
MDESVAIIIAGIGAAIVAGAIGIVSSIISYRVAARQLHNQLADNENNRRHQIILSIIAKRQQALEDIWKLLFVMERRIALSEGELDLYVRSLMWLSSDLRQNCLEALEQHSKKQNFAAHAI